MEREIELKFDPQNPSAGVDLLVRLEQFLADFEAGYIEINSPLRVRDPNGNVWVLETSGRLVLDINPQSIRQLPTTT